MALREQLNKFKKQQEKCQSTLTSIVARAGSTSTPAKPMPAPPAGAGATLPAVKFSDDTERLKYVTGIRKAPVGAQMKRIINFLYEAGTYTRADKRSNMLSNKAVFDSLANNLKLHYDGQWFSYKSKHCVKDKNQLLKLIRSYMEGIKVIEALKAACQVWLLSNFDCQEDIAYPNDPKVPVKVDDDLKQLFRSIELPQDMIDIEKDLQKNGMKPSTNTTQRRLAAQIHGILQKPKLKKKKREISKRTKLTNIHLPELFENLRGS